LALLHLLPAIASAIFQPIPDPKGLQGNLNSLDFAQQLAISIKANADAATAREARKAEEAGDHQKAIRLWGNILGPRFPTYG
jgi:hypothetical protein